MNPDGVLCFRYFIILDELGRGFRDAYVVLLHSEMYNKSTQLWLKGETAVNDFPLGQLFKSPQSSCMASDILGMPSFGWLVVQDVWVNIHINLVLI